MEVEIAPEVTPAEREAALEAVAQALGGRPEPPVYRSAWRRAAIEEGVGNDAGPSGDSPHVTHP